MILRKKFWRVILILLIVLIGIISIIFIFRSFKVKPHNEIKNNEPNFDKKKTTEVTDITFADALDYQSIQPTKKEPEYQGKLLPISSVGTDYKKTGHYQEEEGYISSDACCSDCSAKRGEVTKILFKECGECKKRIEGDGKLRCEKCNEKKFRHDCKDKTLPCGSAILTSSGDLEKSGIKGIIHLATKSIGPKNKKFYPTVQNFIRSIQRAIILAEEKGYKSIAFPLVDNEFLDLILPLEQGSKEKRRLKLAFLIIKSALSQSRKSLERVVFFDFIQRSYILVFPRAVFDYSGNKMLPGAEGFIFNYCNNKQSGGITSYSEHKCEVIVNTTFNAEGKFVGSRGLSGFIANQTGSGKNRIQKEIKECISEFNKRLKNNPCNS